VGTKTDFSFYVPYPFLIGGTKMEISPVFTVLGIINTVISMIACPIIAGYKNRSVVGWLFGGLFLGLIGLIIIACLPKKD
jgi:hypothetical protein